MYGNSLKIFWRNLKKQKTVGVLSIGSLAVAVAVVVLIGLWAVNEFRFDGFHRDKDKMYRVNGLVTLNGEQVKIGATFKKVGKMRSGCSRSCKLCVVLYRYRLIFR